LLPQRDLARTMPRYTQAVMDLGATVCLARKPLCATCPLAQSCVALREGRPESYPVKTRKLKRSAQSLWLLWAQTRDGAVWLRQRPTPGVWAGLYCLELFDSFEALQATVPVAYQDRLQELAVFTHVLTHKDLHLHPVRVLLPARVRPSAQGGWQAAGAWPLLGLPAPVRKLLQQG
jgi:A/G-specific adenine glycosylase